ncbi:metallophosphoesterase [Alkalimarinus coralli]|uniref:metallophosphoesterase n=1 Tax=Alkalimarinus coralli TaxID=2935863 RepID=UPI00202B1AA9|nr:metallophosphoesterase [Alkalimarinus coralli]
MAKSQGYDLIGDVHGCMMTLVKLLEQLGYSKRNGIYQHPSRKVVFIGDIVDRGPRIREALHIVRDMVEHGFAHIVMGNHEYNALGYCTRARPGSGHTFLREHNERHERLIRETLDQFESYSTEWNDFLDWFYQMPLFLDFEDFRVVHACWDQQLIATFKERYGGNLIDEDFLHASAVKDSFAGQVMDRLLRGTDMRLPNGESIVGKDGFTRHFFRTKFWNNNPEIYQDIVFQPDPLPEHIAQHRLTEDEKRQLLSYESHLPPVFVGHYWMSGTPTPIQPNIACLDYSAVKYGKLVAYRMDGEKTLSKDKFVWVDVVKPEM